MDWQNDLLKARDKNGKKYSETYIMIKADERVRGNVRKVSHARPSEHSTFPKKQVLLILGIRTAQPIGGVDNPNAFVLVFGLVRSGNQDLRVGVPYR